MKTKRGRPNLSVDYNRKRHVGNGINSYKNYYKAYWLRNPDKYQEHLQRMREYKRRVRARKRRGEL